MTEVSVIIPWYERAYDQWRDLAFSYIRTWWSDNFPTWQIIVGQMGEDEGPWRKGLAVHRGLQQAKYDLIVVADADVTCDGIGDAVDQITTLRSSWAVPHRMVCRINEDATTLLLQDGRYPPTPYRVGVANPNYVEVYAGAVGGGMTVLPRKLLSDIPIDPRFSGWGQEDYAWGRALTMLAGHPWRGRSPLFHLWHTPQDRISRGVGSTESNTLWLRYQSMATLPMMLDLMEEAKQILAADGVDDPSPESQELPLPVEERDPSLDSGP